jgi:hypothetical protein
LGKNKPNITVMGMHNFVGDGETKAGPMFFRTEEGIEDLVGNLRRYACGGSMMAAPRLPHLRE